MMRRLWETPLPYIQWTHNICHFNVLSASHNITDALNSDQLFLLSGNNSQNPQSLFPPIASKSCFFKLGTQNLKICFWVFLWIFFFFDQCFSYPFPSFLPPFHQVLIFFSVVVQFVIFITARKNP